MSKHYIVVKTNYMYNDEFYYRPESGGGIPEKVFASRAKAEKAREELNAKEFIGIDPREYLAEGEAGPGEAAEKFLESLFDKTSRYGYNIRSDVSLADLKKVAALYNEVSFYEIFEVES